MRRRTEAETVPGRAPWGRGSGPSDLQPAGQQDDVHVVIVMYWAGVYFVWDVLVGWVFDNRSIIAGGLYTLKTFYIISNCHCACVHQTDGAANHR